MKDGTVYKAMNNDRTHYWDLPEIEPPARLSKAIITMIVERDRRNARLQTAAYSLSALVALIAIVPAFQYAMDESAHTGFTQYLSLILSDGSTLLRYWREFSLSLVESFPAFGMTAVLMTIFVLIGSLRLIARNAKNAFLAPHFA